MAVTANFLASHWARVVAGNFHPENLPDLFLGRVAAFFRLADSAWQLGKALLKVGQHGEAQVYLHQAEVSYRLLGKLDKAERMTQRLSALRGFSLSAPQPNRDLNLGNTSAPAPLSYTA